ncbi:HAD family phosphatase [Caulobacter sp. FWC2]|uniref:HAD family hydrolase n=1 Tax=Caulobacter sp. FWC2 TaxID=69664 RepID=UPI000C157DB2|nr:HAD family phosphatase [Caulobacter sp. FWC2]PIB93906.1 HAD family hydrolase [Caulobacter sp. FWC2]
MTLSSPRAVLWDVGNVIVRWDPRALYAKMFEEPADLDRFLSHVCTLDWHVEHDKGVAFPDNAAPLIARFPEHEAQIRAWDARFPEMLSGPIPETAAVIEALAARDVPQFALTNMPQSKWPAVQAMSPVHFGHFRDAIVSGDEGVIKPDRRIYEIVLERTGLQAADLLFIDDSAANIAAAMDIGFHTHHFTDPAHLRAAVERHGLL